MDNTIVAIDALDFGKYKENTEFTRDAIFREINKAYTGFKGTAEMGESEDKRKPIITGKWFFLF